MVAFLILPYNINSWHLWATSICTTAYLRTVYSNVRHHCKIKVLCGEVAAQQPNSLDKIALIGMGKDSNRGGSWQWWKSEGTWRKTAYGGRGLTFAYMYPCFNVWGEEVGVTPEPPHLFHKAHGSICLGCVLLQFKYLQIFSLLRKCPHSFLKKSVRSYSPHWLSVITNATAWN